MTLQQLNPLSSPVEERRLEEVLSNLRSEVKKRRLLMYPYYRDYDRVSGRGGEGMDHKRVHLCTLQATHSTSLLRLCAKWWFGYPISRLLCITLHTHPHLQQVTPPPTPTLTTLLHALLAG